MTPRQRQILVGGLPVADLRQAEVIQEVADFIARRGLDFAFALHVGGLITRHDANYRRALHTASIVYADGASVVLLARAGGARRIQRSPTTDIAIPALINAAKLLSRPVRVALIGGSPGLAERAAHTLEATCPVNIISATHGFHDDWNAVLIEIGSSNPDVIFLGLGSPLEMIWAHEHQQSLPPCTIITCGGWFGFLTGQERRAPHFLARLGLEWLSRLAQQPVRLAPRYLRGGLATVQILASTLIGRMRDHRVL